MHFGYCTLRLSYATLLVHTSSSSSQNFNILVCLCASVSCSAAAVAAAAANVNKLGMCRDPVYVSCLQSKKNHTQNQCIYCMMHVLGREGDGKIKSPKTEWTTEYHAGWCVFQTQLSKRRTQSMFVFLSGFRSLLPFSLRIALCTRVCTLYMCVCVFDCTPSLRANIYPKRSQMDIRSFDLAHP